MKLTILKKDLLEKVKNRALNPKEIEELKENVEIVLVKAAQKEDPKLSIKREGERYRFLVTWGDSVEKFQGFLTAYENFSWCVEVSAKENKE